MGPSRPAGHRERPDVTHRPRLLIAQPSLQPPGGGNAVAVWLIEALQDDHDITVFAWEPVDFDAIHRYVGARLRPREIKVRLVPRVLHWTRKALRVRAALWQRYVLLRSVRRVVDDYDLVISVNNEIDVGRRSLQYIHFPWGWWPRPDADLQWFHRIPGLLSLYYRAGEALAPVSRERIRGNRTLVNSDWTGERFRAVYRGETTTVYPPIPIDDEPLQPWSERHNTFVILGLIAPHKQIETAVSILERVRAAGHHVRLAIAGGVEKKPYLRKIQRMAAERGEWITLHPDITRANLLALLRRSRYGIHAMPEEHFGMAPAEMVRCGCIVFVPRSGGQVEVVGSDPHLAWSNVDEAAAKITRVLADDALQRQLQQKLLAHSERFSGECFRDQVRAIVAEELAGSKMRPS